MAVPHEEHEEFTASDFGALLARLTANDPSLSKFLIAPDLDAGRCIGDDDAIKMASALERNTTVTDIWLQGSSYMHGVTAVGAKSIAKAIQQNKNIRNVLLVSHPTIGDDGARYFADVLAENLSLRSLHLNRCGITSNGASSIAAALKMNKGLYSLYLSGNDIGRSGWEALGDALRVNDNLLSLNLDANNVGHEGAACIAGGLSQNSTLRLLDLSSNKIGPEGAQALASILETKSEPRRITLNLAGNSTLGDVGVSAIASSLKENANLIDLNLSDCDVGNRGAGFLSEALRGNESLQTLFLRNNPAIDDEGARALLSALYCDDSAESVWSSNHTLEYLSFDGVGCVKGRIDEFLKIAKAAGSSTEVARRKIAIYLDEKPLSPDTLQLDSKLNHLLTPRLEMNASSLQCLRCCARNRTRLST